ncbi:protoheme IX farnesyltransferase [Bacteroidota bacterium]
MLRQAQHDILNIFTSLPKLMRLGVSLAVSFSAATGNIVAKFSLELEIIYLILGVFLLAGGASALNQYQERITDSLMSRTKNRPIPSGKISVSTGLILAILLCTVGFLILYFKSGKIPALLGLLNLLWYNGFYTYLKKKTAFAVVPGSLTGVTPLLIGWSAANVSLLNPVIIFISFFIYMWQIPHFWLLHIKYAKDYEKAGLGVLHKLFSDSQIKRIIFAWIIATSFTSLLLPFFGIIHSAYIAVILVGVNIWIDISFYKIIFEEREGFNYKKAFIEINAFMIVVMSLLIIDFLL